MIIGLFGRVLLLLVPAESFEILHCIPQLSSVFTTAYTEGNSGMKAILFSQSLFPQMWYQGVVCTYTLAFQIMLTVTSGKCYLPFLTLFHLTHTLANILLNSKTGQKFAWSDTSEWQFRIAALLSIISAVVAVQLQGRGAFLSFFPGLKM